MCADRIHTRADFRGGVPPNSGIPGKDEARGGSTCTGGISLMSVTIKELLEAVVHLGHQTKRWNPKMKKYLFGERNGIYIIDLQKTLKKFKEAAEFITRVAAEGVPVVFVGTKKQAADVIEEEARRCEQFFVNHRWLGGTLTNFQTIRKSVNRLRQIEETDTKNERIAVREARPLGIPLVAVVDTNCDPEENGSPIPGNDDAIRAIRLMVARI